MGSCKVHDALLMQEALHCHAGILESKIHSQKKKMKDMSNIRYEEEILDGKDDSAKAQIVVGSCGIAFTGDLQAEACH